MKALRKWVQNEQALLYQPRFVDEYDNPEQFSQENMRKPATSIKAHVNRRRLFVLRTGMIPGQAPTAATKDRAPINNIRNYA